MTNDTENQSTERKPLFTLRRITHGKRLNRTHESTITRMDPSVLIVA